MLYPLEPIIIPSCYLCYKDVFQCHGWLDRVNDVGGVPAIWRCEPDCTTVLHQDDKLFSAITGNMPDYTIEDKS